MHVIHVPAYSIYRDMIPPPPPPQSAAVRQRRAIGTVRVDQSSDDKAACGSVIELNKEGNEETCLGACLNLPFVMNATVQSENITYNSVNFTAG